MARVKNLAGASRAARKLRVILRVFFHILPMLFRGLSLRRFLQLARRLLFFLSLFSHNKFVEVNGRTKLDLYLPGFPSRAFLRSCDKLLAFDDRMPCLTVLISVTSACGYRCAHCYQRLDRGKDAPIELVVGAVRRLQDMGVTFFNIEGGEPFSTFDRLLAVCEAIDDRAEIWVNTTGIGVARERLEALSKTPVTALMFSLRAPTEERFDALFGRAGAWRRTMEAVDLCHGVGLPVAFNACLSRDDFFDGTFEAVMEKARELRGSIIQLIHPKRAGGWLEGGVTPFRADDIADIKRRVGLYNSSTRYRDYPAISAQIIEEDAAHFGCTAGGVDRFYINAKGDVQPCEFLNISFGNLGEERFDEIYARMRAAFDPPSTAWLCERYAEKVKALYERNGLDRLPLPAAIGEEVWRGWDPGAPTESYARIERMR